MTPADRDRIQARILLCEDALAGRTLARALRLWGRTDLADTIHQRQVAA